MLDDKAIAQLIKDQNADAINNIYWELPSKTRRIIDKLIAENWRDVSTLSDFLI